jgi:hypothetical protein
MRRAMRIQYRRPRLHTLSGGILQPMADKRVMEDWSFRSSDHKVRAKAQGIYLMHAQGTEFYKIGVAVNPDNRQRELQCGCPFVIKLLYYFRPSSQQAAKIEREMHNQARELRKLSPANNEFFLFDSSREAIAFIKQWDADNSGVSFIAD